MSQRSPAKLEACQRLSSSKSPQPAGGNQGLSQRRLARHICSPQTAFSLSSVGAAYFFELLDVCRPIRDWNHTLPFLSTNISRPMALVLELLLPQTSLALVSPGPSTFESPPAKPRVSYWTKNSPHLLPPVRGPLNRSGSLGMGQCGNLKGCHDRPASFWQRKFRKIRFGGFLQIRQRFLEGLALRSGACFRIVGHQPIAVRIRINDCREV